MTNEEAIEAIKMAVSQVEWEYPLEYAAAFDMAIEALEKQSKWVPVSERLSEAPLQPFTEPKEVDCYIASKGKECFTCKHGRCKSDGKGGFTVYCKHPKNTRETNYKYATECLGESLNRYKHWEPDCDMEDCDMEETNQAVKADSGKPQLTLVPRQILFDIAKVRAFGVKKYGDPDNWKKVEIQRYRDAAFRHFMAYLNDPQGKDEESGLPHLAHLACNIAFICELEKNT